VHGDRSSLEVLGAACQLAAEEAPVSPLHLVTRSLGANWFVPVLVSLPAEWTGQVSTPQAGRPRSSLLGVTCHRTGLGRYTATDYAEVCAHLRPASLRGRRVSRSFRSRSVHLLSSGPVRPLVLYAAEWTGQTPTPQAGRPRSSPPGLVCHRIALATRGQNMPERSVCQLRRRCASALAPHDPFTCCPTGLVPLLVLDASGWTTRRLHRKLAGHDRASRA
jgi:hypothetical protein